LSPVGSREYRGQKQDGSVFPVEFRVALISDEEGLPRALLHVCTDLTERRRTEATLQMREVCAAAQHAAALALAQSVTLGEAASNVLQAICETAGWDAGILWILDAADAVLRCHTIWHGPATDLGGLEELSRQLTLTRGDDLPGHTWASGTVTWIPDIVADARSPRVLMASRAGLRTNLCVPILVSGVIRGVMELFSRIVQEADDDLSQSLSTICAQFGQFMDRKEAEKALEYQARHDALTNLPNRVLLRERMERALVAARAQDTPLAFLLLDLDRFKEVNDTLGHHYGDLLLRQVSSRLAAALRDSDTVARLGGDEFAVLLPATNVAGASQVADKILKVIEEPYRLEGQQVDVGTSIGIAVCPQHGQDAYALMQRADVAMYAAKQAQVGYAVYTATQDEHSPERLSLVAELRLAIAHQRLLLHYQPKVNLKTGQIESVEALARWHHPGRGMVPPDQFVPLAEQSGLIKPLGYFVLNEALRQCKRWQQGALDLAVAVNLSAGNIRDPRLVDVISELLEKHGLDARSLTLEITESAIMGDAQQTIEALTQLHGMGVRIAIDDFGTGYSSLAYLRRLPAHEIKIDRSFVMDMVQQEDDAFIARTVIDLGHRLGLQVVAEGVQSPEVWDMLEDMECDHAQGFYLSRPLSASDLTTWFDESQFEAGTPTRIRRIHTYRRTQAQGA
jgi:diguanylate cyclase (GGDEF)-like protein